MKKFSLLIVLSLCVAFGFTLAEYLINKNFILVNTHQVSQESVTQYLEGSGNVEEQNKRELWVDLPFRVKKTYVSVGDQVKSGQKLMEFDKSALLTKTEYAALAGVGQSKSTDTIRAAIENAATELISPINGIVTAVYVSDNKDVDFSKPVIVISDLDRLIIKAKVSELDLEEVHLGQEALVTGYSFPGTLDAQIVKIYPIAEKGEMALGQAFVEVDLKPQQTEYLKPGTHVDIKFIKEHKDQVIMIPFDAVIFEEERPYVFVNRFGYASKRYVTLGEEYKTNVEITKGLFPEEELVLSPKTKNIKQGSRLSSVN